MLWKQPDFDTNMFVLETTKSFVYSSSEVDKFRRILLDHQPKYDLVDHLLLALYKFLCATATESMFKNIRKETKKIAELKKPLDEMAKEIEIAKSQQKKLDKNSDSYHVLTSALQYTLETIKRRISELKTIDDNIYKYHWEKSSLQKLLEQGVTTDTHTDSYSRT